MRINVQNMLHQAGNAIPARNDRGGYRFGLQQLGEHLRQLRDRTRAGDMKALNVFFALYVFDDDQTGPAAHTQPMQSQMPQHVRDAIGPPVDTDDWDDSQDLMDRDRE